MKIKWKKIVQFKWFKRFYVLYIFGFVLHFRPSLPFFYKFLTNKSFSPNQSTENVLPVLFYSAAVALLPVWFLVEYFKFYPFIVISTLTGIAATCMYIWTDSLLEIQIAQAVYGCATAAELAYFVSVYTHGDPKSYQRLTAFIRAAPLAAKILASFLAQLFVSLDLLTYAELHYLNLAAFIIATILSILLPPIEEPEKTEKFKLSSLWSNLGRCYPNKYVVKWSIWSILTICGFNQFTIYVQPLWQFVQATNGSFAYNGILEGLYAVFALAGTIAGGYAHLDWKYKGDLILSMTSLVEGFMLIFMSQITHIVLNCMFYVFLGFMFHFILTVLSGEIAKFETKGCFGLVFGLIYLLGWALSSGMVALLNSHSGIHIDNFQDLFMIYGFYHLGISILFIVVGLSYWFAKHTYEI